MKVFLFRLIFLLIFFTYGVGVGKYQVFPHDQLSNLKRVFLNVQSPFIEPATTDQINPDKMITEVAFTDPVIGDDFYYSKLGSIDDIYSKNISILVKQDKKISTKDIKLLKQQNIKLQNETFSVLRIEFEYLGFQYETFAYQFSETNCKDQSVNGSLIIPGSGNNQSYGIMKKNKENYHNGILDLLSPFNKLESTYVFIKPNEDFLAWRGPNGKKLGPNFIFQWQINNGGSYALSYHLQILAFHKWMKQCFNKTAIAGLSQGGAATLYASIVSEPDIALVASGHSLMSKFIHWSGLAQFNGFPDKLNYMNLAN